MSRALRCDQCKNFFDPLESGVFTNERLHITNLEIMDPVGTKNNQFVKQLTNLDFCPQCSNKLFKWFAGKAKIVEDEQNDEHYAE